MTYQEKFTPEDFAKLVLLILFLFLAAMATNAQVKPKPDTIRFVQSMDDSYNVLTNDVGPNLRVTSWTLNGVKKDTGKVVAIAGIGTVTINGRGLLIFDCKNDSFAGALPTITYMANNTLSRGVSAKVLVTIFKRPPAPAPIKPAYVIYKENNQIIVDYGGIRYVGVLYAYPVCETVTLYCVVADDSIYRIAKEDYDLLMK